MSEEEHNDVTLYVCTYTIHVEQQALTRAYFHHHPGGLAA